MLVKKSNTEMKISKKLKTRYVEKI